jgi:hypothetical protein
VRGEMPGNQVHHNTVKKYFTKMGVHRKAKKSAPKTTARQQSVIKARLKLLTQHCFSAKSIYKFVMDDESYFLFVKFIRKTKFPAKVLLWLAVSESGISELLFFKAGLAVNKEVYTSKFLPVLQKFIQKHHKNEKIVFWPDLASAHYAKHTWAD